MGTRASVRTFQSTNAPGIGGKKRYRSRMTSEETEAQELPSYIIEQARSGRSKCKGCKRAIDKGELRLGVLIEGPFGEGHMWYHLTCAAKRILPKLEAAYECEAWNNAQAPPDPESLPELTELRELGAKAEAERKQQEQDRKVLPYAELAPSNRSKCKQSGEAIEQGAVRIVLAKQAQFGNQVRKAPFAVLPQHVRAALADPEMETSPHSLLDELRANSKIETARLEEAIEAIGDLD